MTAARLAAARPGLHAAGFTYPLLTLRESALANNIEAMAAYCDRAGVALAPHGKTAMSPELAARQLAHGAWGITVATVGQLRTYRAFGFPRLLLANELVDEAGIAWLAAELAADPGFEAYCYVDSTDGVAILDRVLSHLPGHLPAGRPAAGSVSWWRSATPAGAPAAAPTPRRSTWRRRRPPPARSGWQAWRGTKPGMGPGMREHRGREPGGGARADRRLLPPAAGPGRDPGPTGVRKTGPQAARLRPWRRAHRHGRRQRVLRRGDPRADGGRHRRDDGDPAQRRVRHPRPRALRQRLPRPPGFSGRGGRAGAAARARAVGPGAVPPRARPGPARRRPPRRRLRRRAAGAAARRAPGRAEPG